jgi:hypothetical protein
VVHQLRYAGARSRAHFRAELPRTQLDHPCAQEPNLKVQFGTLERLPRPIPSRKWGRCTFLYTTGERLLAAEELNGLVVQSAEHELQWQARRERGLSADRHCGTAPGVAYSYTRSDRFIR